MPVERVRGGAARAIACFFTFAVACEAREPAPGEHAEPLELGARDRLRFYEVAVPAALDLPRILEDEGLGLFPSADPRDSENRWFVSLLDREGIERALALGLEVYRARTAALRAEEVAAFEREGAIVDDELELEAAGLAGPMAPTPFCTALNAQQIFCRYRDADPNTDLCTTTTSITGALQSLANAYPAVARFVEIDDLTTVEGRRLVGLRVGAQTGTDVPQLFVFGGQHAREWAATGLTLALARWLAALPINDPLRTELQTKAVLFIPVANPDGYAYTFTGGSVERQWRPNRAACAGGTGIDPNRNFPFSWHEDIASCGAQTYGGAEAGDQRETTLLNRMFLNDGLANPPAATYVTRFFVNYHSWGNYVLFPDGLTDAADTESIDPCRDLDTWNANNCQPPEFAVLRWLAGSESAPQLLEEVTNQPYKTDTVWRLLYEAAGDQVSHHSYSHTIEDFDPSIDRRALGISPEVTGGAVQFLAECMALAQWTTLVDRHKLFLTRLIQNLDEVSSESSLGGVADLGNVIGRRLHRLRSDDDPDEANYGPPRIWIDQRVSLPDPTIDTPPGYSGASSSWHTAGLFYETYRWTPDAPYQFPGRFTWCAGTSVPCQDVVTDGSANLCSSALFDILNGWQFTGTTGLGFDDCYFDLTGRGAGPFELRRVLRSIPTGVQVHLNYSYSMDYDAFEANGHVDVEVKLGAGAWQVVRTYPISRVGGHFPGYPAEGPDAFTRLRTENVDLPDAFDHGVNMRVRFRAWGVKNPIPAEFAFRVYDVIMIGRDAD